MRGLTAGLLLVFFPGGSGAAEPPLTSALAASSDTLSMDDATLYYSCLAFSSNRPQACAPLKAFAVNIHYQGGGPPNRPATYDTICLSSFYDLQMSRAGIAGDFREMAKACERHNAVGGDFKRSSTRKACALLAELSRDPVAACRALDPYFASAASKPFCVKELRFLTGDSSLCAALGTEPVNFEICRGNAAFRKAYPTRDRARCGDSIICRVLMGGGSELCGTYAARILSRRRISAAPVPDGKD